MDVLGEMESSEQKVSRPTEDVENTSSLFAMYDVLKELCINNRDYFKTDDSDLGKKFEESFESLHASINSIAPLVDEVRKAATQYDFDKETPGNGYYSFVTVVDAFIVYGVKICRQICVNRSSYFFRKGTQLRQIDMCTEVLVSLKTLLSHLKTLISWSKSGELFPGDEHTPEELLSMGESLNQTCFYGSCLGFQFCESMQGILKGLSILLVGFSEVYYSDGGVIERATNSLWHSSKYVLDPELRARRIVNISQYASVDFCKQFWFLGEMEMMNKLPNFVHPSVAVNRLISIPPEPLTAIKTDGTIIDIPVPSSHVGSASLSVRLLSRVKREGMVGEASSKDSLPKSRGLLFHCHGGGFVAQSSRSHETYLRQWAQSMNAPILSVDYSLAPEAPFPRALEDALYAYCWALKNAEILGTTAERIVFAGDSAGANLCIAVTMKCIELGIRPPDGLFVAYVPVVISLVPSPARLLCLMDPLLPFGFLMGCLKAYACSPEVYAESTKHERKLRRTVRKTKKNGKASLDEPFEEFSSSELMELEGLMKFDNSKNKKTAERHSHTHTSDNNVRPVDFDRKYVLDSETDENGKSVPVLRTSDDEHVLFELPQDAIDPGLPSRITRAAENITSAIKSTFSSITRRMSVDENASDSSITIEEDPLLEKLRLPCPEDQLNFVVPHDPYLSPYWASDDILLQFPPTTVLSLQLDPCLDDCVEFAKKLKRLNKTVKLEILDGLPHGFLNFAMLSKEAHEGSKVCIQRILELMALGEAE